MELHVRETSCLGAVLYCGWVLLVVGLLFGGPVLLARLALPGFRDYLSAEKHHRVTRCRYLTHEYRGDRTCSYTGICGASTCKKQSSYPCFVVMVTAEIDPNNTAMLFRTYRDAEHAQYECSAYECERRGDRVITWFQGLEGLTGFQCYYNPDSPQYLYLETAVHWRVLALFVTAVLMVLLGAWGLLVMLAVLFRCRKLVYVLTCCACCSKYSKSNKVLDRSVEEREGILQALEEGDLQGVKKLVTKHNVNTALTRKQLFVIRTTTPLSYITTRGHLDIMKHLIRIGANVSSQNDASQTLLHCACQSVSRDVVEYCLTAVNCQLMINARDKHGCTPLLTLAKFAKAEYSGEHVMEVAEALVNHGAHASRKCNEGCTALHYAIVNSQRPLVSFLIKAGCVDNAPTIDGVNPPLTALFLVKDAKNLKLIIEAGVNPRSDTQLQEVMRSASGLDPELLSLLRTELLNVAPLTRVCRAVIRACISSPNLQEQLGRLQSAESSPVPIGIIRFLQLEQL